MDLIFFIELILANKMALETLVAAVAVCMHSVVQNFERRLTLRTADDFSAQTLKIAPSDHFLTLLTVEGRQSVSRDAVFVICQSKGRSVSKSVF
jgi:hypothetical protein